MYEVSDSFKLVADYIINQINNSFKEFKRKPEVFIYNIGSSVIDAFKGEAYKGVDKYRSMLVKQSVVIIKAADLGIKDYELKFDHEDYTRNESSLPDNIRNESKKKGFVKGLHFNSINDYFIRYCAFDDILWNTRKSGLFNEVFERVKRTFCARLPELDKLVHATGETAHELVKESYDSFEGAKSGLTYQFERTKEIIDYIKRNKLVNGEFGFTLNYVKDLIDISQRNTINELKKINFNHKVHEQ